MINFLIAAGFVYLASLVVLLRGMRSAPLVEDEDVAQWSAALPEPAEVPHGSYEPSLSTT